MKHRKSPSILTSAALLLTLSCSALQAADYYMTVAGAGNKNGSSWANALAATSISATVNTTMQPGDTLYLGGPEVSGGATYGDTLFTINSSGTSTQRKQLAGVDRGFGFPVFKGIQNVRSYSTIIFASNANYWTVKNLDIEHREYGIRVLGPNFGIILDGIQIADVKEHCFSFTNADDLLVQNCRADGYSQIGFRFNSGCDNVTVKSCVADCTGTGLVDNPAHQTSASTQSPVGFDFHIKSTTTAFNTHILLEDCEALNNAKITPNDPNDYEQGDGFKMEGRNDNITFRRCRAYRNRDGNYDLKGSNQVLEDCYGGHGRYGFKVWYDGDLTNCVAVANSAMQFQCPAGTSGNTITLNYCTLYSGTSTQFGTRIETSGNTVVLNDSIIAYAGAAGTYTSTPSGATTLLNNTVKLANTSNTANSPQFNNPVTAWYGVGTDFDNDTYGLTKGYNSTSNQTPTVPTAPTIIVDNQNASLVGSWTTSTFAAGQFYGVNYLHDGNTGKGTKTARFTPTIPSNGAYDVFAKWSNGDRATNVPYAITHAGGTTTITKDQSAQGGQWVLLGTYNFNAGTLGNVLVSNAGTNGFVIADAIGFAPASQVEVIVDNTEATITGSWFASTFATGQFHGSDYLHDGNAGKGGKTVRFTPAIPFAGTYEVYAKWAAAADRASNVPYTITYATGTANVTKDQRIQGGQWVLLGTYSFNVGTGGNVLVSNASTNNFVMVDAIRFLKQ